MFVGIAEGWLPATTEGLSAEAIRDHMDEIRRLDDFTVAGGTMDEVDAVAARLAALERAEV